MLNQAPVSNPNDFKVVKFHNSTDFDFTPEMGCMYDGRPIFGISGDTGIKAGETIVLPYHIGHRLATNLAKMVQVRKAPIKDEPNNPVGRPLWSDAELENLKSSFIGDLYTEAKPIGQTETERLMAKVEEYRALTEELLRKNAAPVPQSVAAQPEAAAPVAAPVEEAPASPEPVAAAPAAAEPTAPAVFKDKQEVLAELEKRGIKHDKRKSKADLEKLLA